LRSLYGHGKPVCEVEGGGTPDESRGYIWYGRDIDLVLEPIEKIGVVVVDLWECI
jgi:hypothetical protein